MSTNIEKAVIEKLRMLPPEKQQEVLEFVKKLDQRGADETKQAVPKDRMPIWERIAEITKEVPPEAWDELPTDGSINIDHYLYGAPKKQ